LVAINGVSAPGSAVPFEDLYINLFGYGCMGDMYIDCILIVSFGCKSRNTPKVP
jgi:hypothetical protein